MSNPFFEKPILNSPYLCPNRHWELDAHGQPTQKIIERRRRTEFITPIPKPKKRKQKATTQDEIVFDEGKGLSTKAQQYDPTSILDSDWEGEFCRVAEKHRLVRAYVKNHNLGLEVPYRFASEMRIYRPDFIVLVDDGHVDGDPLHLVVEIKGYRREDAKEKKSTTDTYWIPGVNHTKQYGPLAFAELTEVYQIESDFAAKVETEFDRMITTSSAVDRNRKSFSSSAKSFCRRLETSQHGT